MSKVDWCKHEVTVPYGSSDHVRDIITWLQTNVNREDFMFDRRYQMTGDTWQRTILFAFQKDKVHFQTMQKKYITLPGDRNWDIEDWAIKNKITCDYKGPTDHTREKSIYYIPSSKDRVLALLRWS